MLVIERLDKASGIGPRCLVITLKVISSDAFRVIPNIQARSKVFSTVSSYKHGCPQNYTHLQIRS